MDRVITAPLLALVSLFLAGAAHAQPYPSKPIELVVHTGPGGGSDLVARVVADIVSREKLLPQPFVVQNRAGGGGTIAQTYTAGKRGDPYVVQSVAVSVILAVPIRTGLDIGIDKFQPLGLIGIDLNALGVREDSPFKTAADLINAARAKPKSVNIAVGSIGATAHYFIYHIERLTGAKFNVIATKSGADAVTQVLGGHVHATAENVSEMMAHVEAKTMRLLGVPSLKRLSALSNVPTMKEQGYDLHIGSGRGFVSPAGVPREVAVTLEGTVARVSKSAAWKDYMAKNMYEDVYMNAEEFGKHLALHHANMVKFLTEMGLANPKKQ